MSKEQIREDIKNKTMDTVREALAKQGITGHHDIMSIAFIELAAEHIVKLSIEKNKEPDFGLHQEWLLVSCERLSKERSQ